jgi:hypothetical protein
MESDINAVITIARASLSHSETISPHKCKFN